MPGLRRNVPGMKRRYELLPQMRQYDKMGFDWTPYVMLRNQPNFSSEVFNTDDHGFRYTWHDNERLDYQMFQNQVGYKGVVSGGSAAFGVGASDDTKTIPSLLNLESETLWFNFGGRGFNSTQELLIFLFYLPKVRRVLLLSGVNNLVSHMVAARYILPYGGFVADRPFHQLNYRTSRQELLRQLIPGKLRRLVPLRRGASQPIDYQQRFDESLKVVERDLEVWRILRDNKEFSLLYCLQPVAYWTQKNYSPEEQELFSILDHHQGPQWINLFKRIAECYSQYAERLNAMCDAKEIPFLDGNKLLPAEGWSFCDRTHLTDEGSVKLVSALRSELT